VYIKNINTQKKNLIEKAMRCTLQCYRFIIFV